MIEFKNNNIEFNNDEEIIVQVGIEPIYTTINDVIKYVEKQAEKRILRKFYAYSIILLITVATLIILL